MVEGGLPMRKPRLGEVKLSEVTQLELKTNPRGLRSSVSFCFLPGPGRWDSPGPGRGWPGREA